MTYLFESRSTEEGARVSAMAELLNAVCRSRVTVSSSKNLVLVDSSVKMPNRALVLANVLLGN